MDRYKLILIVFLLLSSCSSEPSTDAVTGCWEGPLEFPGLKLTIGFRIGEADGGQLTAVLVRPDMGQKELPLSEVTWDGESLVLGDESAGVRFSGRPRGDGTSIEGKWTHRNRTFPLVIRRVEELTRLRRPQTPVPPFPYVTEETRIENAQAGITLAGTLTLLPGSSPVPCVVLVSGVGGHDRDYTVLGHRRFAVLADHLTQHGIAVLRYDDRGVGESPGDHSMGTSADFATDVLAAVAHLQNDERIDPEQIGILGHSEGGTIAALAAAQSSAVSFVMMIASPGLPGREYNLQFEAAMGAAMGLDAKAVRRKTAFQARVLDILLRDADRDPAQARAAVRELYRTEHSGLPEEQVGAALRRFFSPWFLFNLRHDPGQTLQQVHCPVLAIIGELDRQVPPSENLAAIDAALRAGGNQEITALELPRLNHFLQTSVTGTPTEYGRIEETLAPAALDAMTEWIGAHTRP